MTSDMRLGVNAYALANGIVFTLFMFIITMGAVLSGNRLDSINLLGDLYPGWSPTLLGVCIMTFWMFMAGLFGGALIAILYNFIGD